MRLGLWIWPSFIALAPELWQGGTADVRSEIYALGATIYFLLTGAPPFQSELPGDLHQAHVGLEPEMPSLRSGGPLPDGLEKIVLRCLSKSAGDRYQSVRELSEALAEQALVCDRTDEVAGFSSGINRPSLVI